MKKPPLDPRIGNPATILTANLDVMAPQPEPETEPSPGPLPDSKKKKAKRPTHDLKAVPRAGGRGGIVGAAWLNDDGSFSIQLNTGIALRWDDGLLLRAFPRT